MDISGEIYKWKGSLVVNLKINGFYNKFCSYWGLRVYMFYLLLYFFFLLLILLLLLLLLMLFCFLYMIDLLMENILINLLKIDFCIFDEKKMG